MLRSLPAKPRLEPAWWASPTYVATYGPQVADVCALGNYAPDPEQAMCLDPIFGVAQTGLQAVFEADIIAARQNLKTGLIAQCIVGWLVVTENREIVYSAHNLAAAQQAWETVAAIMESSPALSRLLKPGRGDRPGITEGKGNWAVETRNGCRARFVTRGANTGRALAGDRVVLDEGFAATTTQMGSLLPVLSARPDPQYLLASSAGKIDSAVLIGARDRGRAGGSDRQLYAEWGDVQAGQGCEREARCDHAVTTPGCALDDEERWARIMPALGGRVLVETVRGLRVGMAPLEFARECMVWWDIDGGDGPPPAIDMNVWRLRERTKAEAPTRAAVFVDVSPSGDMATIAAAGPGSGDRTLVITLTAPGTAWLVPQLKALADRDDIEVIGLWPQSKAGALIPTLVKHEVEHETVTTTWMGQACTLIQNKIRDDEVEHVGQTTLDAAVKNATTRWSGEAELWNRRDLAGPDISPIVAASGAVALWEGFANDDYAVEESYL